MSFVEYRGHFDRWHRGLAAVTPEKYDSGDITYILAQYKISETEKSTDRALVTPFDINTDQWVINIATLWTESKRTYHPGTIKLGLPHNSNPTWGQYRSMGDLYCNTQFKLNQSEHIMLVH